MGKHRRKAVVRASKELSDIFVRKKSGNLEEWNPAKIRAAIGKSADRIATKLSDEEIAHIVYRVEASVLAREGNVIPVEHVHGLVEQALKAFRPDVAESYMDYRNWVKREAEMNRQVWEECQSIQYLGDKSNSNADSTLVSTKRVKKLDALETAQYRHYFLNSEEKKAEAAGYIYIHDKSARQDSMNCCLFNITEVLSGGFYMGNIWYNEPKDADVAFDVIGDITLMSASQQYGRRTV